MHEKTADFADSASRAADAVSAALVDLKAKAAALCFRGEQDALDYAAHSVEHVCGLLANNSLDAVDRYIKGDVGCYLRCHSRRSNLKGDLAFFSVPSEAGARGADGLHGPASADHVGGEEYDRSFNPEGDQTAVFLGITELIEGPEGIIPSFVWLEPAKERRDFRWQILADSAASVDVVVKIGGGIGERKIGFYELGVSAGQGAGVPGLIESSPQITGNIEQDAGQHLRQLSSELDLVNMLPRIRISLRRVGPWAAIDKIVDERIEVLDMLLCVNERQPRAIKDITHGHKIRSDERSRISAGT